MDQSGFKFVERFRDIKEFRYFKFRSQDRPPFSLYLANFSPGVLPARHVPGNSNFDLELRRPLCAKPLCSQHLFQSIQKGILSSPGKTFESASDELKFRGIWRSSSRTSNKWWMLQRFFSLRRAFDILLDRYRVEKKGAFKEANWRSASTLIDRSIPLLSSRA